MQSVAGMAAVGDVASALGVRAEEAPMVAELKAGSEEAFAWLVARYHQPIYSLVYRIVNDPADAADTTQEVFLKLYTRRSGFEPRRLHPCHVRQHRQRQRRRHLPPTAAGADRAGG